MNAAGPGHNLGPMERADDLILNADKWIKERPEITDDEQAGACQLAIDQLLAVKADLEQARDTERKPHDDAIAAITVRFRDKLMMVGIAVVRLREIAGAWLSKKRERIAAEAVERQRLADEAKRKANEAITTAVTTPSVGADFEAQRATEAAQTAEVAALKPAARAQVRGEYSSKAMSLHAYWHAEVIEGRESEALRSYAKNPAVRAVALKKAKQLAGELARREKREDAAPPGFRFFKTEKAL
jgi:hypothetical protein